MINGIGLSSMGSTGEGLISETTSVTSAFSQFGVAAADHTSLLNSRVVS